MASCLGRLTSSPQAPLPFVSSEARRTCFCGEGVQGCLCGLVGLTKEKKPSLVKTTGPGTPGPGECPRCFGVCEGARSHADPGFDRRVEDTGWWQLGTPAPHQCSGMRWGEREAASGSLGEV